MIYIHHEIICAYKLDKYLIENTLGNFPLKLFVFKILQKNYENLSYYQFHYEQ